MKNLDIMTVPTGCEPSRLFMHDSRWDEDLLLLTGFASPAGYRTFVANREVDEQGVPTALVLEWHGTHRSRIFGEYAYCGWGRYEHRLGVFVTSAAQLDEHRHTTPVVAAAVTGVLANWASIKEWDPTSSEGAEGVSAFWRVAEAGHHFSKDVAAKLSMLGLERSAVKGNCWTGVRPKAHTRYRTNGG